jgi:hypothetical protein
MMVMLVDPSIFDAVLLNCIIMCYTVLMRLHPLNSVPNGSEYLITSFVLKIFIFIT